MMKMRLWASPLAAEGFVSDEYYILCTVCFSRSFVVLKMALTLLEELLAKLIEVVLIEVR